MSDNKADDLTENQVKIDIWGSCIERDTFRVVEEKRCREGSIKVNKYFKGCAYVSQFAKRNGPVLKMTDMPLLMSEKQSMSAMLNKKCLLADYNKTVVKELKESGSEWLIISPMVDSHGICKIVYPDGKYDYVTKDVSNEYAVSEILWRKGVANNVEDLQLDYPDEDYQTALDKLVKFVKERYGDKVILDCAYDANYFLDSDGSIQEMEGSWVVRDNYFSARFNRDFIRATGCHYINSPMFQMSDVFHAWGFHPSHFIEEHYDYLMKCIETIVFGGDDKREILEDLYLEYEAKFAAIRYGEILSVSNGIGRYESLREQGRDIEALNLLNVMVKQGLPQAKVELAKLYGYGDLVEKDIPHAERLILDAKDEGYGFAISTLFDIYWDDGDPSRYAEMVEMVREDSVIKNRESQLRLARAYRYGVGVEKDLDEAASILRRLSRGQRKEGIRNEFFDILWEKDDPDTYEEMIESVYRLAMSGYKDSMARYGLA